MARSIWSGSLSFGLVNIPVKLTTAVREERIAFHMLHDEDNVRLRQKMVCPRDGEEVHREHTVKGYEISPDHYVIIQESELEAIAPPSSRIIEIRDFVDLKDIDPVFYDRPYYLLPQANAEKSYRLLVQAMQRTGKVGIAKFTMRAKEYLCALRPTEGLICLETMHFNDEVTAARDVEAVPHASKSGSDVDDRQLEVAKKLIESLSTSFKPEQYHDEYNQRVMELIQKKAHGEHIVATPHHAEKQTRAGDLMAALEASLAKARGETASTPAKTRGKAPAEHLKPSERSPAHHRHRSTGSATHRRNSA